MHHQHQPLPTCSNTFLRRVEDMEHILRERIALLPGVRDKDNSPIIFCPARDINSNIEHVRNLLLYLYDVTADDAKSRGFVFVIDMRRGTSWDVVKPILKSLQEYFPAKINYVYIIKPEKFLDKYKISTAKYTKFELQMVSADALTKYIDYCQIPKEFGGSFKFDYDEWIEIRREIERLVHRISEILKNLDRISFEMSSAEMPIDALSAQKSVSTHSNLYPVLTSAPIEEFEKEILSIKERLIYEKNGMKNQYQQNGIVCTPNPDLIAVFPNLLQLLKSLVKTRNEVLYNWETRKTELDQYSQLKLFEQDAENLSQWICKHFNSLTHRFVLIGENELETNRLLKEHLDFADSVNKIEVSYTQVLTVGLRLLNIQKLGLNKIESISLQLKNDWKQFLTRIDQRTQLLQIAASAHKKCNLFLKSADQWQMDVGVDPNKISINDLPIAAKRHQEFQKIYRSSYAEAHEELQQLAKLLKKYFGESVNQLPITSIIQEQLLLIGNTFKGINTVWEARDITIQNKLSSADFVTDLNSVLDWLNQHGEPFLHRKTGIGVDPESANILTQNHQKFRAVAINTNKNAEQIFKLRHVLDDADESVRIEANKKVEELVLKINNFKQCMEHRTFLLHLAYYFYLHYAEIMDWYSKLDSRATYICIVPESVEHCEENKDTFQKDNNLTDQAYDRVMAEAVQLLQSLKKQRELLDIDNSESVAHVEHLKKDIENRHLNEKERWKEQRIYLNTASKISTFLRDCFEIKKQLESWRQDLQGLRHSVSNTVEIIKQYHTQNTVKVQQVVSDAMKQLSEILELIQSKELHMVYAADSNIPIEEAIVTAARQLQNLEDEVMNIAKDISNRIELSIHLNKLRQMAHEVVEAIERQQMRLRQFFHIPGNEQETDLETKYFNEFRIEIEMFEEKISRFYNEKERFTSLPLLALESHAETRVRAENLLTDVKAKWQSLVGLIDIRYKLLTAANSYYKYTKLLLPTSQSIEKDLSMDRDGDFCKSGSWISLEHCYESTQERLEKHSSHKERFLEASVYAQRTADQFMNFMRRIQAPREHVEARLFEVQKYKDTIRERQTIILRLWTECHAKIDKCQNSVKIKLMAKNVIDWSDRELASCVVIIDNVEKTRKLDIIARRKKLEELLEHCLTLRDLVKVERYEVRKMLGEAKKFLESFPSDFHSVEVEKYSLLAKTKLQNIWSMLSKSEQTVRDELNGLDGQHVLEPAKNEQLCLDRYSDSTIEDKLAGKDDEPQKKIAEPMKELLKSEADYIEDMRRCVDIYLFAYKTAGSMCPLSIRGKEREIFGNIEELYQFHSKIFLSELYSYEQNPEDVGYCFIAWMEKLKELYADYCLNKEENNYLICLPEAISMFSEIREQNNLEPCQDLQSLVIKPVQRITKYHVLLKELFKHSTKNTKEIKNAYEIVVSIPKLANDRMHLKSFEDYQKYNVGDFVMQDTFLVSEPKRYFKREREFQIFLFESNIVFTKREELSSKKIGYVFKDSMLLRELHVVEHIEGDNTKFGLRKSAFPYQNDQNTTVVKANTEAQRILWVKTLRDLKMDIGRHKTVGGVNTESNRGSRDSQSSLILQSVVASTTLAQLPLEDGSCLSFQSADSGHNSLYSSTGHVIMRETKNEVVEHGFEHFNNNNNVEDKQQYYTTTEDFTACNSEQLTILSGQRIEILTTNCNNSDEDNNNEFIKIAVLDKFGQRENEGLVPKRLLMPLDGSDQPMASTSHAHDETASTPSSSNKRTSIRRFFTSSSQKGESKQQRSSPSGTVIRPKSATSTTTNSDFTTTNCIDQNKNNNNNKILSPSTKINNNKTQQEIPSANHNDLLDLPPPMDQLGVGDKENGEHENELNPSENNTTTEAIAETSNSAPSPPQMSAEETCRLKRSYVLQELVETERAYVVDLASIVDGYIGTLKEMELSDEDREKVKIIFANIEQILDFHKSVFCKEIEKSLEDYEAAGNAFIKYERRLHTFYVKYCQNKPKSDFLVSQDNFEQLLFDVKDRLGHKVSINDLLIKPVQRITKYQLMLSDILKYTHRANDRAEVLERAHDVMRVVPKACDDMMQVGRLQGFQGNLTAQGRLIFQGTLIISDGNIIQPFKGKERRVFLFEQSVIIAECIPPRKEYGNPLYNFKNQIMVNKMILEENVVDEPLRFVLQSNDPNQPATFVAQSQSIEDKEQWLIKLSAQLDQQKTFLAALVDPKRYLANSMGSMNISGKKDSSGSLGTPTSPGVSSTIGNITIPTSGLGGGSTASGAISPTKPRATQQKSSGSKLFGFGKQKT